MKGSLLIISIFIITGAHSNSENDLESVFKENEIIPDVIDSISDSKIEITFENNVKVSNPGIELTPTEVQHKPQLKWAHEPDTLYTLVMTDPDAPRRKKPVTGEFNHWIVGNIYGNDVDNGETIHDYIGSGPPKNTGLHRYVFMVFKQPGKIQFNLPFASNTSIKTRGNFSTRQFATNHGLGTPIAGNFYQAQYDDYVPKLHASFRF